MVAGGDECGRVALRLYVMHRRVMIEVIEHLFAILGSAIIIGPACARCEFIVAQHIQHTYCRKAYFEQIGALRHTSSYQQATIGASGYGEVLFRCVFFFDQVFGCGNKVIEYILLLHLDACIVPGIAILAAATQVGHSVYPSMLYKGKVAHAKGWSHADVEATIAI